MKQLFQFSKIMKWNTFIISYIFQTIVVYVVFNKTLVTWYATERERERERGKGRSIPLPFCVWINGH